MMKLTTSSKKALSDNNIQNVLSNNDINNLVSFANTYQNSTAIDSKDVAKQLEKFSKDTYSKLSDKMKDKYKDDADNAFQKIKKLFSKTIFKKSI